VATVAQITFTVGADESVQTRASVAVVSVVMTGRTVSARFV